jgi:hypothetical protein
MIKIRSLEILFREVYVTEKIIDTAIFCITHAVHF